MKKLLLLVLATMLLAVHTNAKKPQLAYKQWFLMERQANKEKQPNDSISLSYRITHNSNYPQWGAQYDMSFPQIHLIITIKNFKNFANKFGSMGQNAGCNMPAF